MPLLSIIIPVYNSENYLQACLDSIINQSFTDFEILLINDGSTDRSSILCDEYSRKDCRIHLFHKENNGVSSARNTGLDNAKGTWVLFVDSDDLLPSNALNYLIEITNSDIDMSLGGFSKFDDQHSVLETIRPSASIISPENCVDWFVTPVLRNGDWQRYIWNRLFRLSIININSIRFREDIHYKEDGLFLIQYLTRCTNKVACTPEIVYLYRQVSSSAMGKLNSSYNERLLSIVDAHGEIYRQITDAGISKDIRKRELKHLLDNYYWILDIMQNSGSDTRTNKRLLRSRIIKNGGVFNYLYYVIILHYWGALKRRLP